MVPYALDLDPIDEDIAPKLTSIELVYHTGEQNPTWITHKSTFERGEVTYPHYRIISSSLNCSPNDESIGWWMCPSLSLNQNHDKLEPGR